MWEAAEPVVTDYIVSELGPRPSCATPSGGLEAIGRVIHRFPDFAAGLEVFANNMPDLIENGIHINDDDLMELAKESRTGLVISHIAQVASAIALVVIAWQLTFG